CRGGTPWPPIAAQFEGSAMINRHRNEFPTLASGIHLLSHSLGPVPRAARESMIAYCDAWEHHTSEDAWATSWWTLSRRVGDRIARILGGEAGSVQIQPNTSIALATVASCFDFKSSARNKVITTALDFPSMEYFWDGQRQVGARVEVIPSPDGVSVPLEQILDAIDTETCLVAMSHTSYRSSWRVNARAIVERAHAKGALVLLDVYQSAGVVQLDASDWNVDFLIGGTIKWLCGGPSCGYLYVRPDLQGDLRPRLTGWVAHDSPFEFAHAPMRYAKSVRRFAQGTPSIPALYSAIPGLEIIEAVSVSEIAAESQRRTELMIDFASERGWTINTPREKSQRGGTVMIVVDDAQATAERLATRRVFVDWRPGAGLRISPHFFNTDEEIEESLNILAELINR
ncbi:MAG TPA: aminotransferase class V-fold PLP-dependent enzyme, partial [Pyrinomonadaceae bacterium]|nr:aminotransferase class V-fold PLP-dependent enzyme [Pyrinomonadaceae bacterium]